MVGGGEWRGRRRDRGTGGRGQGAGIDILGDFGEGRQNRQRTN